jgi:phospholipase/carboxylesterase
MQWRLDGAGDDPTAPLIVALHGHSMDEDAFALLIQQLFALPCRVLVPRAPWPVDVRSENRIGWSWYPYDGDQDRFRTDLAHTESILLDVLAAAEAQAGLRPRRRFLLGFSQGGYCGAVIALRHLEIFSGLIVSGARVKTEILVAEMQRAAREHFEVLLVHGRRDLEILPEAAERGRAALAAAGVSVDLQYVDRGHTLGRAQMDIVAPWLAARLG